MNESTAKMIDSIEDEQHRSTIKELADFVDGMPTEEQEPNAAFLVQRSFFVDLLNAVEYLASDDITITSTNGEVLATITGQEATDITHAAVDHYIRKILIEASLRVLNESNTKHDQHQS